MRLRGLGLSFSWLEDVGHGDVGSRLMKGITRVIMWLLGVYDLFTRTPGPSK